MQPTELYTCAGVLLALPVILAFVALSRWRQASLAGRNTNPEQQRVGLRLLLVQTFVPPLQVLPLLRSVTVAPSQLGSACVVLLPAASLLIGITSSYFVVRSSRGVARVALPLLNLLVCTYSAALLIAAGATA